MPLPEGRKPLSDQDMVNLLHSISKDLISRDYRLSEELTQTANRLKELSSKEKATLNE